MSEEVRPPGMTTIAPDVLIAIARLATLSVEGVSSMSPVKSGVNRLLKRTHQGDGVVVEIDDDIVNIDIYTVLQKNINIRAVSREIQNNIARAISEMVGMQVGFINIHIEDINYNPEV
jgi:uncharacterized alkaline shock family protein YloU